MSQILPTDKPSSESDIRQLAKAAASDVKIFVTQDQDLLEKVKEIAALTELQVLSPTELIIQLHELSERQSYTPERIAGLNLSWKRLASPDLASFPYNSFLNHGERQGKFREKLGSFLATPNLYKCQLLQSGNEVIAIRIFSSDSDKILTVPLARLARSADQLLFGRFLIADTVSKAISQNLDMVQLDSLRISPSLVTDILEMGFTKCNGNFVRFCFSRCLDRAEVLSAIAELCPESIDNYRNMLKPELGQHCSPLSLASDQNHFLIPIRPGYAMSLLGTRLSSDDLLGGEPSVLLRWDNVYYRKKTRHKMLAPPGRILWYVSESQKQIVAVSHLDEVEVGTPQELFKKFKKFGILKWDAIYEMCKGDISKEIMALKFSHTFLFREPISLKDMRTVYEEDGFWLGLQSPSKIPVATFRKLFHRGYPDSS